MSSENHSARILLSHNSNLITHYFQFNLWLPQAGIKTLTVKINFYY